MSDDRESLREELSALIDGALPAERRRELEAQIERDAQLRQDYEELRRTVHLVRSLPPLVAPPELRERLRAARPRGRLLRISPWWTVAAAAAGVLLAVVLQGPGSRPDGDADRTLEAAHDKEAKRDAASGLQDGREAAGSLRRLSERDGAAKNELGAPSDGERAGGPGFDEGARRQAAEPAEPAEPADDAQAPAEAPAEAKTRAETLDRSAPTAQRARAEEEAEDVSEAASGNREPVAPAAPEPGRAARGKAASGFGQQPGPAAERGTWGERVLAGERPPSRLERVLYLQELELLDDATLRTHFARLAERRNSAEQLPPRPREDAWRDSQAELPASGEARLADRFEATRTRELLLRAYPSPTGDAVRDGEGVRLGRTAQVAEDALPVDLELSPRELSGVLALFDVLDPDRFARAAARARATAKEAPAAPPASSSPATASGIDPKSTPGKAGADAAETESARASDVRRPVRVVLHFGPRPEPAAGPRAEAAESPREQPGDGAR